ncbi:BTB/POZ domain-containing protein At3g49900 [Cajanus cajan]|uniref:BTB/POZ domain-containing protein At1g30440 family n=1 Tax=Cajanus cajan TaxID=3821 RepID=A0A151SC25_CAJCA|nr:BTB/POZ domain-containing protein At3g49900 [Cajanus cajan]KYP52385.1 BTB/POZ domain-containing protein At1g30440 family [Cajanus cajan]
MKSWNQFGAIETIYEEEREFSSPSLSPSSSSSSPPSLHSIINAWSLDSGCEPDVLIRVQGTSFHLHKDRMISQSSYLKRHLTGVSNVALSPPLNITAETFAAVAEFCYRRRVHLTARNVAAVRVAAEMLGMTLTVGESLRDVAESYLERVVGSDASRVLRSCVPLLPEAETTASLASRCIEALVWEGDDVTFLDVVVEMHPQDFQTVAYSLNRRLPNHDVLYMMVDLYLKENKYGNLTEDQKTEICNSIDCAKLSRGTLVNCVQNPRMPLRFMVRAILVEHLNTRRSVAAAASGAQQAEQRTSLREFLQRDTAHRQAAQIKEAMDSTYSRIQSLERELRGMKKVLLDNSNALNSERSASFHYVPPESSRIQRGGRGSVSSSGFLLRDGTKKNDDEVGSYTLSAGPCHHGNKVPKMTRFFGHRFITGLKNAFRISNSTSN